uniref:Uncharacterized protein n=1 Tax=Pseudictyota dubia TaxID=2749911 RepID=A0A7R9VN69_9STRA|mmetsp:Transcript_17842/g.33173  ORF Transcript_17842/g.33173 Transcript_17842/m.33173 type:complete len:134 (+) Transcript_17842:447-848(+)
MGQVGNIDDHLVSNPGLARPVGGADKVPVEIGSSCKTSISSLSSAHKALFQYLHALLIYEGGEQEREGKNLIISVRGIPERHTNEKECDSKCCTSNFRSNPWKRLPPAVRCRITRAKGFVPKGKEPRRVVELT